MPPFITAPATDFDGLGNLTTLANATLHATASTIGLSAGVSLRGVHLSEASPAFTVTAASAPPEYLGGLTYDAIFTVGQAVDVDVLGAFSDATTATSKAGFTLPAGLSWSAGHIVGAALLVQGRDWHTIVVTGPLGSLEFEILISVKPDMPNGAFRDGGGDLIPYTTTVQPPGTTTWSTNVEGISNTLIRNVTFTGAFDVEDCYNVGFENCTFNGRVTNRSSEKIFYMGGTVDHSAELDGWRLSGSGTGCHDITAMGLTVRNARKDGVNSAGDASFNTGLRLLNLLVEDVGSAVGAGAGFEHGMYIHHYAEVQGCVIRRCPYGNGISARSAIRARNNFIEDTLESAISVFHDHARSDPFTFLAEGNVIIRLIGEHGVRLRDATGSRAPNVLDSYTVRNNRFGTGVSATNVGPGYGGTTLVGLEGVGVQGNIRISTATALGLVP